MKIVVISDIHGSYDALKLFDETYDELWVLGDLVNYGPQPSEVIDNVRRKASIIIQGNHDYAVANDDDSRWSDRYRELSTITRKFTASNITHKQKEFLGKLPQQLQLERNGEVFHLTHATVTDNHYGKWPKDDEGIMEQISMLPANVIFCGHSHIPYIREAGGKIIINPGSIGQSRSGYPVSSYAVWDDGKIVIRNFKYPIDLTVEKINRLGFPKHISNELGKILITATV